MGDWRVPFVSFGDRRRGRNVDEKELFKEAFEEVGMEVNNNQYLTTANKAICQSLVYSIEEAE